MNVKLIPYIIVYIIISVILLFTIDSAKIEKIDEFKDENYLKITNNSQIQLKTLIKEKQNTTASIGISLTSNDNIRRALEKNDKSLVNLNQLSKDLRKNTDFKNVWFQLISKDGISLQRSWTAKSGDKISNVRLDIQQMFKKPQLMNTISVGKFDLTFKSMGPVFDNNKKFLGIIEVITHFNSISKKLSKEGTNTIILADKSYKKQLKKAFTGSFVDDYYIANFDAQTEYLNFLKNKGVEKTIEKLKNSSYIVDTNIDSIVSYYQILNVNNNPMGHFVLFNSLDNIEQIKLENIKYIYDLYKFLSIIFLTMAFYFLYSIKMIKDNRTNYAFKLAVIIIVIYIALTATIYQLIDIKYKSDIKRYSTSVKNQTMLEYDSILNKNKDIAQLVFTSYLDTNVIKEFIKNNDRKKLHNYLENDYEKLKSKYHVRQLHFHLPDSKSFLRMHKPEKYGDDLTGIRESVTYVNQYLKPYYGFEEGRIFNGYRHVFPLIDKENKPLGSVEVSFDIYSIMDYHLNLFGAQRVNFLLKEDVVNKKVFTDEKSNYIKSPIEGFCFDKIVLKKLKDQNKNIIPHKKSKEVLYEISQTILKGKTFIKYFPNISELTVIHPLINNLTGEVVGSVHISKNDIYIKDKLNEFHILIAILLIILSFIMVFIFRELMAKQKIQFEFEKSQKILDSQNSFVIITNGKNISASNSSMLDFFGYNSLDLFKEKHDCICGYFEYETGKNYLQQTMGEENWFEYIQKNDNSNLKVKMYDKDKNSHIFKIEYNNNPISSNEYIVSFLDITLIENTNQILEQKTTEQKQLLSLFDKGEITLFKWKIGKEYTTQYVSSNVSKILGYTSEEFTENQLSYFDVIDMDEQNIVRETFDSAIKNNIEFFTHEPYKIITKQGNIKYILTNSILIKDTQNKTSHLLSYLIDITKLKDMEQQLIENEKMASLGTMIGNIAHQWRQPLSAITTAASGMQIEQQYDLLTEDKIHDYNDCIIKNATFLSQTIDTFRNFIKETKENKEVIIQDRITTVLEIFDATLKNHHIKLINKIDHTNPIKKVLPLGELSQVITNILNNAKDALVSNKIDDPTITIECTTVNNDVIITIEDNAGGIPSDVLPKIFEPYFTTKHQSQGTGLGLYMSHKIMFENLGGKLYVKNTNSGAKFYIELNED